MPGRTGAEGIRRAWLPLLIDSARRFAGSWRATGGADARRPRLWYPIAIRMREGDAGVYARRALAPGEVVFPLLGHLTVRPSRSTIQLAPGVHLEPAAEAPAPWRYLNHSCAPNVAVALPGRMVVALRSVAAGEELRFDYNTTEWDMAAPFVCACGAPDCVGLVHGFRHLSPARQQALLAAAAPHIRALHSSSRVTIP